MAITKEVAITADSACDLPDDIVSERNITIIPLSVLIGGEEHLDGVDIKPSQIYDCVSRTGDMPKTAAVPPGRYAEVFSSLVSQGRSVVHIGLSSGISSSYQNACTAAANFDNVYCIDSKSLCTAMGLLVLKGCDLRDRGMNAKRIAERLNRTVPKLSATFVLDNLEYIYKGGRCSSVARFGANVLGIKPSIEVNNSTGTLQIAKKYRGRPDVVYKQYINDSLDDIGKIDTHRLVIANSGMIPPEISAFAKGVAEGKGRFDEIICAEAGCTVSAHCGSKTLAVFYIRK